MGKVAWKKWKKRYHVLYEVADKLYALCSYKEKKEKKSENNESILLDGYFVDYIEADKGNFSKFKKKLRYLFEISSDGTYLTLTDIIFCVYSSTDGWDT